MMLRCLSQDDSNSNEKFSVTTAPFLEKPANRAADVFPLHVVLQANCGLFRVINRLPYKKPPAGVLNRVA